jgi:hypothetical protein
MRKWGPGFALLILWACQSGPTPAEAQARKRAMIEEALSAAPARLAPGATVMDWENNVLRQGTNGWTCFPSPPMLTNGSAPMCMDGPWMKWADAWAKREPFKTDRVGISYMLAGDGGASNIDPFAEGPTDDNEWVEEGPHLMILVPDPAMLEGVSTDPHHGGPYVMWKGTPYAHIMVPVDTK